MIWKCTLSQAIQNVDDFIHYIICSVMDPLQWMGAVRMRADKKNNNNPQVITLVHQFMYCEVKSYMFVRD